MTSERAIRPAGGSRSQEDELRLAAYDALLAHLAAADALRRHTVAGQRRGAAWQRRYDELCDQAARAADEWRSYLGPLGGARSGAARVTDTTRATTTDGAERPNDEHHVGPDLDAEAGPLTRLTQGRAS